MKEEQSRMYKQPFFLTAGRLLAILLVGFYSINPHAAVAGCRVSRFRQRFVHHNNFAKVIQVQKVQQFVAVPVNPYYFSYNNISAFSGYGGGYSSGLLQNYGIQPIAQQPIIPQPIVQPAVQQQQAQYQQTQYQQTQQQTQQQLPPQQQTDSRYVTQEQFQDFANKVFRALDIPEEIPPVTPQPDNNPGNPPPDPQPPASGAPTLQEVVGILERNHCAQCHSGPNSKGDYPIFLSGQIADNLNWDRIATKMLTQSMPPRESGHAPVPTEEAFRVSLFADLVTQ